MDRGNAAVVKWVECKNFFLLNRGSIVKILLEVVFFIHICIFIVHYLIYDQLLTYFCRCIKQNKIKPKR